MKTLSETAFYIASSQTFMIDDVVYGMKLIACEIYDVSMSKLEEEMEKVFT